MKFSALLILVSILLSAVLPPALPLLTNHGRSAEIGTLDVCHSVIPAFSSNGEMPCIHECSRFLMTPELCATATEETIHVQPFLLAFLDERPPEVSYFFRQPCSENIKQL